MHPKPTLVETPPAAVAADEPEPAQETHHCDDCNEAVPGPDVLREVVVAYRPTQTRQWCSVCVDAKTWECDRCDRLLRNDVPELNAAQPHGGGEVCPYCYDEDFFTCEGCERVLHNDDYGTDGYCQRCDEPEEERESAEIDDYARAYSGVYHAQQRGPFPTLRLCGVELECEQGDASTLADALPDEVGIHSDGSLDDRTGAEIVTPPASGTELERLIRESCQAARRAGYATTSACGLHVHVEYPQEEAAVRRLFATVYALEDVVYGLLADSRIGNTYCVPLRSSYAFEGPRVAFWRKWYVHKPVEKHKSNETRYHGLNLHSVYYRGTVEFRHHEGTLIEQEAVNWVRVCQSLVQYALKRFRRADLLEELRRPAHRDWEGKLDRVADLLAWPQDLQAWARQRVAECGVRRTPYPKPAAAPDMLVRLREDRQAPEERQWAKARAGLELLAQAVA